MALRVRYQHTSGATLGYSIERLSDGLFYDHSDHTFKGSGWGTLVASLPEDTGIFAGRYKATLASAFTPITQFTTPDYAVTIHDTIAGKVVGQSAVLMVNGDDQTPETALPFGIVFGSPSTTLVQLQMQGGSLPDAGGLWIKRQILVVGSAAGGARTHLSRYGIATHGYAPSGGGGGLGLHSLTWDPAKPLAVTLQANDVVQIAGFGE